MPGAGSISCQASAAWLPDWSNLYTGREELEAEYLTRRQQHGSQTGQTFIQEGKNWRQNILPGAGSMAPRLIKPLCRRGKIELEAEYLARRRQHVSKADQTFMQEGKNWSPPSRRSEN